MSRTWPLPLVLSIGIGFALAPSALAEPATLTVAVRGLGRVTSVPEGIDCPSRCSWSFPSGTRVELRASPEGAAAFAGWQGACARTGNCAITLGADTVVLARFGEEEPTPPAPVRRELCRGCSMAEKAVRAELFLEPIDASLERARPRFAAAEETRPVLRRLEAEAAEMRAAAARVARGEVCDGARAAAAGTTKLRASLEAASAARPRPLVAALAARRGRFGDADDRDLLVVQHRHRQTLAARVHRAADEARAAFAGLCEAVQRPVSIQGRVSAIESGKRRIRLDDPVAAGAGRTVVLARKLFRTPIYEGAKVTLRGLVFTDGSDLVLEAVPFEPPVLQQAVCLKLRLAPFQDFPFNAGALDPSIVLHDPAGYRSGDVHWLEEGMRLALEQVCTPHASTGHRYFAQLDLAYQRWNGDTSTAASETLEANMGASYTPAELPDDIDPDADATLTVKEFRVACTKHMEGVPPHQHMVHDCDSPLHTATNTFKLRVRPRGSFATAVYDHTLFALEDVYSTTEFASAKVISVSTSSPVSAGHNPVFEARGYRVTSGNSSRPNVQTVALNQKFAVYHDAPDVDYGSGLSWPRIKGTRSGKPFWYTVQLPELVRDVVDFCGNQPDAFYRLPWAWGTLATVTQGNLSTFTHTPGSSNAFAFDLIMPNLTPIYAARGGVVSEVIESNSINDDPDDDHDAAGDPNFLQVDHDDGTNSSYLHMIKNGVVVAEGQRVRRGQHVAIVGNTGFSTDPHLHFQVGDASAASMLIRFEAFAVPEPTECFTPLQGTSLLSNNAEP